MEFPIVDLISAPENVLKIIYTACRTCYSADYPIDIFKENDLDCDNFNQNDCRDNHYDDNNCNNGRCPIEKNNQKMLKLVKKVLDSGHHSTIEHCQFVFSISGVSRACTHQMVRHRHMSFCEKSQRYVTEKGQFEYVVPPTIKDQLLLDEYNEFMGKISDFYAKMIEQGIPAEDARFVLPNAATSSMIASLNLRELIHLANLRLCTNAQHEIRAVVQKMCDLVISKEPWLEEYLQPKCVKNGYCDEINKCGRF
jgi:thymidylate synthase (FAD)